ncbi:MAG: acyl-CoA thioesterase [Lentisphaeria bacterium]|nr:acyl-CoA thioesterase [Lentisphaeria bacterium]
MGRKSFFPVVEGAPPPLRLCVRRRVRFDEVDSMRIVWHGRYASYFEDGRVALGHKYGISYSDFIRENIPVPIRRLQVEYLQPLLFEDEFEVETILHWSEAARINFEYAVRKLDGSLVCTGCTVQMILDETFEVLLAPPPFFQDFLECWQRGELS